jgi:hypothetical protein
MITDLGWEIEQIEENSNGEDRKMITIFENGIKYWEAKDKSMCGSHTWDEVSSISSEQGEEASSRVTATRVALIGIFALAAPKKKAGTRFVTVEGDGFFWMLEAPTREAMEFVAKAKNAKAKYNE